MLKYNLEKMFLLKGVTSVSQFLQNNGFSRNTAYKFAGKKYENLSLKHLEKFCLIFNCTPNDLIEWTPDRKEQINENISLKKLLPSEQVNIFNEILSVPYEKLGDIAKKIEEIKKSV